MRPWFEARVGRGRSLLPIVGSIALVGLVLPFVARASTGARPDRIEILVGVTSEGAPSDLWLELLARRLPPAAEAEAAALRKPMTGPERAWVDRIRRRVDVWSHRIGGLAAPFEPVERPAAIRIVLGNRAGEDAFAHDPVTIGFDLSKLVALYGDAGTVENRDRIDRLFAHEYTHLLQEAWLPAHPQPRESPIERAEIEIWAEGLGNYYSLSSRWRTHDGEPSATATEALARLEPIFVERIEALACASPEEAARLRADLSNGPFDRKWGALTVALWLERETVADPMALRRFVQAGTAGVIDLAGRHLAPRELERYEQARRPGRACAAATAGHESPR